MNEPLRRALPPRCRLRRQKMRWLHRQEMWRVLRQKVRSLLCQEVRSLRRQEVTRKVSPPTATEPHASAAQTPVHG